MCGVFGALLAYVVHSDEVRCLRWRKSGIVFSAIMAVLVVAEMAIA